MIRASVILTTYNRTDALRASLAGFLSQKTRNFELIVADDGSTGDTGELVQQFALLADFPLRHVWQEDRGFRAAAARNRALATATAEYVIFVDGDCIPQPDFVQRHLSLAEAGFFLGGNRILLSEAFTQRALAGQLPLHHWSPAQWLFARIRGDINRVLPLLHLPDGSFRCRHPNQWEGIKTCNLSAWRADLERINGFDETYSGWGLEDSDLVIRLLHSGVKHKSARFSSALFHLWHKENDRSQLPENRRRLEDLLGSTRIEAQQGLNQYA